MSITCTVKIKTTRDAEHAWDMFLEFVEGPFGAFSDQQAVMEEQIRGRDFKGILLSIRFYIKRDTYYKDVSPTAKKTLELLRKWAAGNGKLVEGKMPLSPS